MGKIGLDKLVARAADKLAGRQVKLDNQQEVVVVEAKAAEGFEEMMANALPKPTEWEQAIDDSLKGDYPTPYKAGMPKVERLSQTTTDANGRKLRSPEKQALHNAEAKAKMGKRLTHAEKAVLGKHRLALLLVNMKIKREWRQGKS